MRARGQTRTTLRHRVARPAVAGATVGAVVTPAPLFAAAVAGQGSLAAAVGVATALAVAGHAALAAARTDDGGLTAGDDPARRAALAGCGALLAGVLPALSFLLASGGFPLAVGVLALELGVVTALAVRAAGADPLAATVRVGLAGALAAALGAGLGSLAGL